MTDLRKAAEMALEAMERRNSVNDEYKVYLQDAIETLRQALGHPVAYKYTDKRNPLVFYFTTHKDSKPSPSVIETALYAAPLNKQEEE